VGAAVETQLATIPALMDCLARNCPQSSAGSFRDRSHWQRPQSVGDGGQLLANGIFTIRVPVRELWPVWPHIVQRPPPPHIIASVELTDCAPLR
jgi:hypothetical protein